MLDKAKIIHTLQQVTLPAKHGVVPASDYVSSIVIKDDKIGLMLDLPAEFAARHAVIERDIQAALRQIGVHQCNIVTTAHHQDANTAHHTPAKQAQWRSDPLPHVKRIIAVLSGKGGVGKSTITALLACAFAQAGQRVGIIDADITGPSQAHLFGLHGKPDVEDGLMLPVMAGDIAVMSTALLLDDGQAATMRGPMISKTLHKLLRGTRWGSNDAPIDILLVDMPPGTSDVHLSMVQQLPLGLHGSGAMIVTTPQSLALIDARRAISMLRNVHVPLLGIIENMSWFDGPNGTISYPFGKGGGAILADESNTAILSSLPLTPILQELADTGNIQNYKINEEFTALVSLMQETTKPH